MARLAYVLLIVGAFGAVLAPLAYRRVKAKLDRVLIGVVFVACAISGLLAGWWLLDGGAAT